MAESLATEIRDSALVAATDICVKCGLCLPHCPTYQRTSDENESPRGRLSLIQGWATGTLERTAKLEQHVSNCLLCRSCEAACPANVTYGRIIDDFRAQQNESPPSDEKEARLQGMVLGLIKGNYPKFIKTGLSHLARTGAGQTIARQLGLEAMAHGLPTPPSGTRTIGAGVYPATAAESNGGIQLFLGCTADLLDTETLDATVNLLNAMGIEVEVPEGQSCCGALDQHAGDRSTANALIHQNETAFQSADNKPVISCATGCGAMLKDYGSTPESIGKRHADISTYLSNLHWPEDLHLAPLEGTVLLHTPCSLRNVLKSPLAPAKLLERIPGLKIQAISGDIRCCGAAGSFMLSHPEEAAYYREAILKEAVQSSPQYLVSSNPGCAAHLRAGLKQQGMEVEVIHPVSLIWRQAKIARKPHSKDDS